MIVNIINGKGFLNLSANGWRSIFIRFKNNKTPNHIKRNGSKMIPKEGNKIPTAIEDAITIRRIESSLSE